MDTHMDVVLNNIDAENNSLTEKVSCLENEVIRLNYQNEELQKALEKQKAFHRNFANEVVVMEEVRMKDFKAENQSLNEQNKELIKANRQLKIDVAFYKQAHEEIANEVVKPDMARSSQSTKRTANTFSSSDSPPQGPATTKRVTRKTVSSTAASTSSDHQNVSRRSPISDCKQTSSKVLSKVNVQMFVENKKLKSQITALNTTISMLKKKNKQLENFRLKIDNKKLKFHEDSAELDRLIASTKKKNKYTFNTEALAILREIVQYKM